MGARLTQLLRGLVDVLAAATGMAAVLAVLWQAHWALAPIMAVGVAPGFWVMLTMRRKTYWVYRMRTPENRLANYFGNLLTKLKMAGRAEAFKEDRGMPDDAVTPEYVVDKLAIYGSPERVVEQLLAFREEIGDFGTLLYAGKDWTDRDMGRRSMVLMAEKVLPKLNAAIGK